MLGLLAMMALADPCGMVPPVSVNADTSIAREGAQRTYVFYKDGIETIALRPGFRGSVEDFGMLIPFPTPPALRKIEDDTFSHIEAALDPPKIFVRKKIERKYKMKRSVMPKASNRSIAVQKEEAVVVLNEEAVGMYQVAVLEAGSSKALARWMTDNGYRYPKGMDSVTDDYVKQGWCFVAIKAAVGVASGVRPEPGKRSVDPSRAAGSVFNGHVQGMAFRFKIDKPVVPMRLSVFNGPDPRNVVYFLSDSPSKIEELSDTLVVEQLKGSKLYKNLTEPLEVEFDSVLQPFQLDADDKKRLAEMRNYDPMVHIAKTLFASDLLAAKEGQLSLPMEEREKEYLRVSEAFGLRGADIDVLHGEELQKERKAVVEATLSDISRMHLSVMDGVFDGTVLAEKNLTFSSHTISFPKGRNEPLKQYDRTLWVY